MKPLILVLLTAAVFGVRADDQSRERPLSANAKAELLTTMRDAFADKRISKAQYDEAVSWVHSEPCDGVDRRLTERTKVKLQSALAKEQRLPSVRVSESFRSDGWVILYTDAGEGDESYLFYFADPATGSDPVAAWSGAATIFETTEMIQWVKDNAKGIPRRLAECFSWHVTLNRY